MIREHKELSHAEVMNLSIIQLVDLYNDAVEEISSLRIKLMYEQELCELYSEAYDELSNILYG